jgi:capsular polysaccharide biosynthesis protein
MLIFLGAILGLFGAFGSASLADATDVRVRGTRDLEALLGMTPMAAIPYIDGAGDAKRRTTTNVVIALAVTAACAALLIMLLSR